MRSAMKRVWLKLVTMALMLLVLFGVVAGCGKEETLPEGTCYVVTVVQTHKESGSTVTLTLTYDSEGKLLRHQEGSVRTDYTYDDQGRMLSSYGYQLEWDVPLQVIDYTYDEEGKLIQEKGYYMVEDNNDYCHTYAYDDEGNRIKTTVYFGGELLGEYLYSANGDLLEYSNRLHNSGERYTYSDDGKLVKETRGSLDAPNNIMDYFYDEQGRLSKTVETYQNLKGKMKCVREYSYDAAGKLVQRNISSTDSGRKRYDYGYDHEDRLISYLYTKNGDTGGYRWEYDGQGNMTACHHENAYIDRYLWTYDEDGFVTSWAYDLTVFEYTYTWPEGEVPQAVKDSVASYVAQMVELDRHTTGKHTSDHYNAMSSYRLP